jgi:hypothetical protein
MAMHPRLGRARSEPRLDPVRWRRPGHGALLRLATIATLLGVAAAVLLVRPQTCTSSPLTASPSRSPAAPGSSPPTGPAVTPGGTSTGQGRNTTAIPPGTVGVPIRLAEPTALTLVHAGDTVDLLRVDDTGRGGTPVATAALVLNVTAADDPTSGALLLALHPDEAQRAIAVPGRGFAILIRPD